ncbi:MAG: PE-PPE domain-containing protein [Mycobacterium sp.]|nr:PE-PPE domain-containing protein [Mycobacterium sp.]
MQSVLGGICAIGLVAAVVFSPAAGAAVPEDRLILGGSEYQLAEMFPAIAALPLVARYVTPNRQIGAGFFPDTNPVLIDYPASLFGKGSANEHISIGADALDAAIRERQQPLAVVGQSEGTIVLDTERARLENDPDAPAPDQLEFVLFNSPTRGLVTTLFREGTHIPFVDLTVAPPVESRYDTSLIIHEYDIWGDFPDRPWNLLTLVNAVAAMVFAHQLAYEVPSQLAPENVTTVVNSKGATDTTYFVPAATLPLTEILRVVGMPDRAVDALDNAIRPLIDAGYSRNDKPGDPRPYLDHGVVTTHQKSDRTADAAISPSTVQAAATPEPSEMTEVVPRQVRTSRIGNARRQTGGTGIAGAPSGGQNLPSPSIRRVIGDGTATHPVGAAALRRHHAVRS